MKDKIIKLLESSNIDDVSIGINLWIAKYPFRELIHKEFNCINFFIVHNSTVYRTFSTKKLEQTFLKVKELEHLDYKEIIL